MTDSIELNTSFVNEQTVTSANGVSHSSTDPTGPFIFYLSKFVPLLLNSHLKIAETISSDFEKYLNEKNSVDIIRKFLSDPQTRTLVIQKQSINEEELSPDDSVSQYVLSTEIQYTPSKCLSVQLIKRGAIVESDKNFPSQIRIISLSDSSPYETLHSYVSNTLAPYFKSYIRRGLQESPNPNEVSNLPNSAVKDQLVSVMEKRIDEVELGFLHLQQNIDIPEIGFDFHPYIINLARKCNDENRKHKYDDCAEYLEDSNFLNQLQTNVNRWIRDIKNIARLDRDPSNGTTLQEINFWINLEKALNKIVEKRETTEVSLTLDMLRYSKRFITTVSFDSAIVSLKETIECAKDYNSLLRDFPLNDLFTSSEFTKIAFAIQNLFAHLKKIRNSKYPLSRLLKLIEAISKDLSAQMSKTLYTQQLMLIGYDDFERVYKSSMLVFHVWDDEYEKFHGLLREISKRKREDAALMWRINSVHKRLQLRLNKIHTFRYQHDQLCSVINRVLKPTQIRDNSDNILSPNASNDLKSKIFSFSLDIADANAIEEVSLAYEKVKETDVLDLSDGGQQLWETAKNKYDEKIERVESRMTARLRDQLGTAKNANEMFRIFAKFNALLVRPHVRGAIREYQDLKAQLIRRVKEDIESLQEKFKQHYTHSRTARMSRVRDIPPVAGTIIWTKQLERQLNMYMKRVEHVLGKGWETHVDGQKLKEDGENFRLKLNTQEIFDDWSENVAKKKLPTSNPIFQVDTAKTLLGNCAYTLKVNFSPEIITLTKEVRNMKWLVPRVQLSILNKAHTARQIYPFAISLLDSISSFRRICEQINKNNQSACQLLVAAMKKEIQNLIMEMSSLVWDSYKLEANIPKFSDVIFSFKERVDVMFVTVEQIEQNLDNLYACPYKRVYFSEILNEIQKLIDSLSLKGFSNISQWVTSLDQDISKRLSVRLSLAILVWMKTLTNAKQKACTEDEEDKEKPAQKLQLIQLNDSFRFDEYLNRNDLKSLNQLYEMNGDEPLIKTKVLEILIKNQVLFASPSIEDVRSHVFNQLYEYTSVLTSLKRIEHSRYQVTMSAAHSDFKGTYQNLLTYSTNTVQLMEYTVASIDDLLNQVREYINEWLQFQAVWDLHSEMLYARLGNELRLWTDCLNGMKHSRKSLDILENHRTFGPIQVDYTRVQSKISVKYDAWHKDVLNKFGALLNSEVKSFQRQCLMSRQELENKSVEAANSSSEAVSIITYVQGLKRNLNEWTHKVITYREAQNVLMNQRYQFPNDWTFTDQINGEWSAFNEILVRKDQSIQKHVTEFQTKILSEEKSVDTRTTELVNEWDTSKPIDEDLNPEEALQLLQQFESKLKAMNEDQTKMAKAKEALELGSKINKMTSSKVLASLEELNDLKEVWSEINKIHKQINKLKEKQWITIQPRQIRSALEDIIKQLKEMPSRLRQYASYNHVKQTLQGFLKANMLITELKSEALKERHWKLLMKQLKVVWNLNDLTLGSVWQTNLLNHEASIKSIMSIAQGEKALEEFLRQVNELWKQYILESINYQNKCQIIKSWDDLFNKLKEHIGSLSAMKLSPYYKQFEEEAVSWEDKLNRMNTIFDLWIDVQRRWVYLDGIFTNSADLKHLLPNETQKFQSVSSEYITLMKKVTKSSLVLDVLNIQGVEKLLERLADLLAKLQKALGEYLERERSSCPRFYFVGDDDLLQVIGNTNNINKLEKHFKKMFSGVNSLLLNSDLENTVVGVASKEGEELLFKTHISIEKNPNIKDWLRLIETEMRFTLASLLQQSVNEMRQLNSAVTLDKESYLKWIDKYQAQLVVLTVQIIWSESVEKAMSIDLNTVLLNVEQTLKILADSVLMNQSTIKRRKLEHLIIEYVHQRDVIRSLLANQVDSVSCFEWLKQMRFYLDEANPLITEQLTVRIADAEFKYGFEYLGIQDRLVQTPLTDRCYLTMSQALKARLGGSPFGPAGTGKTETVKALAAQLGQFVLVFNCDETFDFQAMGRIFVGLCQVGAWGCFDEFNRLEERMLSAVSQQIQTIQEALKQDTQEIAKKPIVIELVDKKVTISSNMAIFITMNPGYAGRSNLPDNLKNLFRSLAMTQPDNVLIAQVLLYSQGFRTAEKLAQKIVPFFKLCNEQLSKQSHYDFGLRSLKSVLVMAGKLNRQKLETMPIKEEYSDKESLNEQELLIQSIMESFVPRLINDDLPLLYSLLSDVFPGVTYRNNEIKGLKEEIKTVCQEMNLVCESSWLEKVLQLYAISNLNHGLMMVGMSGTGKSTAWRVLLKALSRIEANEGVAHVIDPKALSKEDLYGSMDLNTREWSDGLFTHILRRILDNVRGELTKRQWIVFDGDVDPEWVENLNSVLDDNKLLTLPNGERLGIPPNVRIMFEVQDLKYATLATVSRCGMIWFSEDVVSLDMIYANYLNKLTNTPLDETEAGMNEQRMAASLYEQFLSANGLVTKCLEMASKLDHIMDFVRLRALDSLFSFLNQNVRNIITYNQQHDFKLSMHQTENYLIKSLLLAVLWSFSGDCLLKNRKELSRFVYMLTSIQLPNDTESLIDYTVELTTGDWFLWSKKVPQIEIESHKITAPDLVIPTIDTIRHENILYTWISEHKPLLLCGPPGSGKTMTLFAALRSLPDFEVVGLNFSSTTNPEILLRTFSHYCEYKKTSDGIVLAPVQLGKWLVLFCDEINLPDEDEYGTQRVISFMRQCIEHNGFYRRQDHSWIKLERIQFVGACNPPTDPGRKLLSHRFLRHVPLIYVDYPGEISLKQIYGTFNRAILRQFSNLRVYSESMTNAMVEFYLASQNRFTVEEQPHYIYSPRELTRWTRGIYEAARPLENVFVDDLVRMFAHEAMRLFHDRLVTDEERKWTETSIETIACKHFANMNPDKALKKPILYSNWLRKEYSPVDEEELREYVKARLKVFCEEELDVRLVLFNEVLDHVLRIDRIYKQPQGHLLLIGVAGAGKTTLSRFVAWINNMSVFQIKVHKNYSTKEFDQDLRNVLRRSGTKREKIVFILDESNVLDVSFLEKMNTLLANGEVPGLFEGDELTALMSQCKEEAQKVGLMLNSPDELYKWFTNEIIRNLHVVFTMNPTGQNGLRDRAVTSPALFNRCVLNWFGDWSQMACYQVGHEFTIRTDLDRTNYVAPNIPQLLIENTSLEMTHREACLNVFVQIHASLQEMNMKLEKKGQKTVSITPRHYIDFINHFVKLYNEKRAELEEQQMHFNMGLAKIRETVQQVEELQKSLAVKRAELEKKNTEANLKLKQMLNDQQEAQNKKAASEDLKIILKEQSELIAEKEKSVSYDLSQVEPALLEARKAVESINKQNLEELKRMMNPPVLVKLSMDSIFLILTGQEAVDFKITKAFISKDTFIRTILDFKSENITSQTKDKMKKIYLENPDYDFNKINNASKACGPLVKWTKAQISYIEMLNKVEPLRNELQSLSNIAKENIIKEASLSNLISELEQSIVRYEQEYADLISQAQIIKADLTSVQVKVERSVSLLNSLSSEQIRWETSSHLFKNQMSTIIGDVLLNSAFIAYSGYYDQLVRNQLMNTWKQYLDNFNIEYTPDFDRIEYLSTADERMLWHSKSLPKDELCIENAIMLKRFNRFPLVIDPSGQATQFILNMYRDRKIVRASFLDKSFRKNLESALRFGNPILIQDAENYDPILNPVLNREIRKTGGRCLITLGDQDIDFSPSFVMFLSTRDPSLQFPSDLCSRVTFVNFTVTRSSLQSQCLHTVLKIERADVAEKQSNFIKIQGEYQQQLRHLEKDLLNSLNESNGNILSNDDVITRLENLKKEAADIAAKIAQTDQVISQIQLVIDEYHILAEACSKIYFTLEALPHIHYLYQYSLQFFFDIFTRVLTENENLNGIKDSHKRLSIILKDLFYLTFKRVARGMLNSDRILIALLFAKQFIECDTKNNLKDIDAEFKLLESPFKIGIKKTASSISFDLSSKLTSDQLEAIFHLSSLPIFKQLEKILQSNLSDFYEWLSSSYPEKQVPEYFVYKSDESVSAYLKRLLIVKAFRPERFTASVRLFIARVFGSEKFLTQMDEQLDLYSLVKNELKSTQPILMCSLSGFDPSNQVEELASKINKRLNAIAIGSAEGFFQAEKVINGASKTGDWVLLKNVHLAPEWLIELEKKLHTLQPHSEFRIFLSTEINPKLPSNLVRLSCCLVFEPPTGVKASLLRTLSQITSVRMNKKPIERSRLYFLLAWMHAIAQERLRYVPIGWSKPYEFNEFDMKSSLDIIDAWIDLAAGDRNNLPLNKIPFQALYSLISECVYGAKIDNSYDIRLLSTFLKEIFSIKSFDGESHLLNVDSFQIDMPDSINREQFIEWINNQINYEQSPVWLGLSSTAENVLLTSKCHLTVSKLKRLAIINEFEFNDSKEDSKPMWIKQLNDSVNEWLNLLRNNILKGIKRSAENIKDPLFRFYEREINSNIELLNIVLDDLNDVQLILKGTKKQTNHHRILTSHLARGQIPNQWLKYKLPRNLGVQSWIVDFNERIKQMALVGHKFTEQGLPWLKEYTVWLGGLSTPEAYLTATRQFVSQTKSWSLEELVSIVSVYDERKDFKLDDCSFCMTGLKMLGAKYQSNSVQLTSDLKNDLDYIVIKWSKLENKNHLKTNDQIDLPVYLYSSRNDLLFTLSMQTNENQHEFYMRGVAIVASTLE